MNYRMTSILSVIILYIFFYPGYNEKRLWNTEFDNVRNSLYNTILYGLLIFNTGLYWYNQN